MEELSHYGPSLHVKFSDEYVFAAYGPYIQCYKYMTGELVNQCRIFKRNKVHGFDITDDKKFIIAYGAKSVTISLLEEVLNSNDLVEKEHLVEEWLITASFSKSGNRAFLLTCYNRVIICDLQASVIEIKALPNERSILYSGSIKPLTENEVYINAGTVMNGIIVWELFSEKNIYNLTGHEGSIFYVTLSDNDRFIASCSDDRSIILWDMVTGKQLSTGWGHTARIWNLKFFNDDTQLISVSEDCTCRIWDVVENQNEGFDLIQKNIYEVHQIKNVWSVDVCENDMIAVTAGNDGRLKITDLKQSTRYGDEEEEFSLDQLSKTSNIVFSKGEMIKGFEWFNFGLIALTSKGKIIKYTKNTKSWSLVKVIDELQLYSITNGVQNNNTVIFLSNKCEIFLMKFDNIGEHIHTTNHVVPNLSKSTNSMVCEINSESFLITVESPNPKDDFVCLKIESSTLEILDEYRFTKPDNFVSTSLEIYQKYLLVGSRYSALCIYDLNAIKNTPIVLRRLNPGDTTTSIKFVGIQDGHPIFSITNRDGFYNVISINFDKMSNNDKSFYKVIHQNKVVKGFLEGGYYNSNNEYIIYGFKSSLFYIYNETQSYEITSQVCGGAHRQWKLFNDGENLILIYLKPSKIHFRRIYKSFVPEVLKNGMHGREIRDISILKEKQYNGGYLFCTGSEDTTIKLSHFNKNDGQVTNYWLERQHVSGLQRCKFINSHYMISCSAREELFLWNVNSESLERAYITVQKSLPTSTDNPDLRIMDFDVKFLKNRKDFILSSVYSDSVIKVWYYNSSNNTFKLLIEGRYETSCIFNITLEILKDKLLLIITPTDGHVIVYNITDYIPFEVVVNEVFLRDNKLEVGLSTLPEYDTKFKVHQSGIKAIDTKIAADKESVLLFTGGDDNGLGIVELKIALDTNKIVGSILDFNEKAASSTITSIILCKNDNELLVTSVDQIVSMWNISNNSLVEQSRKYTTIADTGSADVVALEDGNEVALVGGVGLSVWRL